MNNEKQINIHLSKNDFDLLKESALKMGMSQTVYLRLLIRSCQLTVTPKK
jgi:predicted DNA binding CopG/RHH family protein